APVSPHVTPPLPSNALRPVLPLEWARDSIRTPVQHATENRRHSGSPVTNCRHPRRGTDASGSLAQHAGETGTRLRPDILRADGKPPHFAPEIDGHRVPDKIRYSRLIMFQPCQPDHIYYQVVVGEVLTPCT